MGTHHARWLLCSQIDTLVLLLALYHLNDSLISVPGEAVG